MIKSRSKNKSLTIQKETWTQLKNDIQTHKKKKLIIHKPKCKEQNFYINISRKIKENPTVLKLESWKYLELIKSEQKCQVLIWAICMESELNRVRCYKGRFCILCLYSNFIRRSEHRLKMMNWRENGGWGTGKLYSEAASTVFFCGPLPIWFFVDASYHH